MTDLVGKCRLASIVRQCLLSEAAAADQQQGEGMHGAEGIMSGKAPIGALPQHLLRGTGIGLAALAAQWVSLALWDHTRDSQIIWLPVPLLLALLLTSGY